MEGYIQKLSNGKLKRYVQFLEISDDPELMAQYRYWHSEGHHWQEIREGIRAVGILEMEIYMRHNQLVMIVDAPAEHLKVLFAVPCDPAQQQRFSRIIEHSSL